jgi:hypothetical protein
VRDRCRAIVDTLDGADLLHWCRDREWPELRVIPGLLSGRVFEEDPVDPEDADNVGRELAWDANDQEVTVHIRAFDEPTVLRTPPPAPRADQTTQKVEKEVDEPPRLRRQKVSRTDPVTQSSSRVHMVRIGLALAVLATTLVLVFFATFSVMLYLLQRFGG